MEEDLIIDTDFDWIEELKDDLLQYMYYYNHERPHLGIDGKMPIEMLETKPGKWCRRMAIICKTIIIATVEYRSTVSE